MVVVGQELVGPESRTPTLSDAKTLALDYEWTEHELVALDSLLLPFFEVAGRSAPHSVVEVEIEVAASKLQLAAFNFQLLIFSFNFQLSAFRIQ